MEPIYLAIIVFFIAIFFSMLGLGGALLYVPIFYWSGLPLLVAIPTGLLLNGITATSASITYLRKKLVEPSIAIPLIITSVIGAQTGAYLAHLIKTNLLLASFSLVLIFAGTRLLLFRDIGIRVQPAPKKRLILIPLLGFLIGTIAALLGVGGGTFIVPLLLALGYNPRNASATSAFIVIFLSFSGFAGYAALGTEDLDPGLLIYTSIAVLLGAQIGTGIIFEKVRSSAINRIFGGILLFVAARIIYGLL